MIGNVWDLCQDRFGAYTSDAQTNPQGPVSGSYRINRGGSGKSNAVYCTVASREGDYYGFIYNYLGFRLVLEFK